MKKSFLTIVLIIGLCFQAVAQSTLSVSGKVTDLSGKGIAGVVLNDGIHFTQTDKQGRWALTTDTLVSKFISISTPAAYVLPQTDGLADRFYVSIRELAATQTHDFRLEKRPKVNKNFYYIAISDPQVRNEKEMKRWRTETVVDIHAVVDSLKQLREVVGVALGDLVFDRMDLYEEYKTSLKNSGMTAFQCIGNHDFDRRYADLHNMEAGTPVYGEMYYYQYFGPTDYSFNIGKVHVVTLKNIDYEGQKKYIERLSEAQLNWLKNDLSYVPKGTLVLLNMHAAGWNRIENGGNVRNAAKLEEILRGYNVHVFCGHTHFFQNNEVNPNLYEHNIGAACGAWWSGWVNRCGAPNGYMVVEVNNDKLKWHYKSTGRDFTHQFRTYGKGEFNSQPNYVVANVWDWDSTCKVVWYQDGKRMGAMEQFTDVDEEYLKTLKNKTNACQTAHLFRALPSDNAQEIRIELTNRFGETYTETVKL